MSSCTPLRFQLPRRRVRSRGTGRRLRGIRYAAMALVDRNGVYGARFHMAPKGRHSRHIGSEIAAPTASHTPAVETREGYQNCAADHPHEAARPKRRGRPRAMSWRNSPAVLSVSRVTRCPPAGIFGQHNATPSSSVTTIASRRRANQAIVECARGSACAGRTNSVAYATPAERELLDVLTCVRKKRRCHRAGCWSATPNATSRRPPNARLFADLPRPSPTHSKFLRASSSPWPTSATNSRATPCPGRTQMSFLRKAWMKARAALQPYYERARRRSSASCAHRKLKLPATSSSSGTLCASAKRTHPGAGTRLGRNSAVCYSLEITAVDPWAWTCFRALPLRRARRVARHRH